MGNPLIYQSDWTPCLAIDYPVIQNTPIFHWIVVDAIGVRIWCVCVT